MNSYRDSFESDGKQAWATVGDAVPTECSLVDCPAIGRTTLINRLSTVAFRLAAAASLAQGPAAGRLHSAIHDLDLLIADVRRDSV